jgi:hypothetical protein
MAMYAYFNMSAAIWDKFQFNDRKGATIDDDEYIWVNACRLCIGRVLEIYEHLPRDEQLEANVVKIHHAAKQHLQLTTHYGSYVGSPFGRRFRSVSSNRLPPLRSLNAPLGSLKAGQQEVRPDNCPGCGVANRSGFAFCRKCGTSRTAPETSGPVRPTPPPATGTNDPVIALIKGDTPAACI